MDVVSPTPVFIPPPTTPPFLLPYPSDIWFFATDKFTKSFGPIYGAADHQINLFTDFGAAESFVKFDRTVNIMTVDELATTANNIGEYPIVFKLVDETDMKRSIINEVIYRFTLTIYRKVAYVGGI